MKIAVTAAGASLDAQVDPRFGRCPCFMIINAESMDFEAIKNPNAALGGGAGVQAGQLMAEKEVQFVLTGNCGPNAHQALSAAGIQIVVGCAGVVREVVERFKADGFNAAGAPSVASHFGMAGASDSPRDMPASPRQGAAPDAGASMGRGMRGGGGRGMGGGRGRGMEMRGGNLGAAAPLTQPSADQDSSKEDELASLKAQAEAMSQGLQEVNEKIARLERDAEDS